MKNIFKVVVCSFIISITLVMMNTVDVFAKTEAGDSMRVGVTAVIPENQIDKNQSYFDLLMKPGQKQVLEVKLSNSSDEDVTVEVRANSALTNDHGVVDYSTIETPENRDATLKVSFSDIAQTENELIVPKQSEITAKINVEMPADPYKGVIAGGIYVTEKESDSKKDDKDAGGVQIKNKFVFVVGAQLRNEESLEGLVPDLILDKKKILPKHVNYRNFLGINFQNTESIFIRDLEIDAKVYIKDKAEVLHETKLEGLKMAPNSNFNFGVDWENKEFAGGTYRVVVNAHSKDYDKKWDWEEEFTIDAELAKKLNKEAVGIDKNYTTWIILGGIALAVLLIVIIIMLILNNTKKNRRKAARKRKKSTKDNSVKKSKGSRKKSS